MLCALPLQPDGPIQQSRIDSSFSSEAEIWNQKLTIGIFVKAYSTSSSSSTDSASSSSDK